jgi:hypothetical protein
MADETVTTQTVTNAPTPAPSQTEGVVVSAPSAGTDAKPVETSSTSTPLTVEQASKAFRERLTDAEKNTPLEVEDTSASLDPNEGFEPPTLGADGRWRHKDGSFAPDPTKPVAEQAAPAEAAPVDPNAPVVDPAAVVDPNAPPVETQPEPITVTLKGRNGEAREVEVTDPDLADLLRANANDGMRRNEFNAKSATLEAGFAELNAFKQMIEENPEDVVLAHMKPDAQARLAESLIATHWDALVERILALDADPSRRAVVAAETRVRTMQQAQRLNDVRASSERASQIETAVRAMIPESVSDSTIEQFMSDAGSDVARAIQSGKAVTPDSVKEILAPRIALYRFDEAKTPTVVGANAVPSTAGTQASASPVVVRPAVSLKQAPAVTGAPSVVDPAKAALRTQQLIQARSISAAVAPSGAGAPAVRAPAVPKGATIEEASKHLRQTLGRSGWAQATP